MSEVEEKKKVTDKSDANEEFEQSLLQLRNDLDTDLKPQPEIKQKKVVAIDLASEPDSRAHLTEKERLIQDCWELYCRISDSGYEFPPEKRRTEYKLSRTSVANLKIILAELLDLGRQIETKSQIASLDTGVIPRPVMSSADRVEQSVAQSVANAEIVAEQLFHFNLLFTHFLESASCHPKISKVTKTDLSGLTESISEDKESLMPILERIYLDNSEIMSGLLTPMNQYFFHMSRHVGSVAISNAMYGSGQNEDDSDETEGESEVDDVE